MFRRNNISKVLIAAIGMAVAMRNISWGQPPEIPYMPTLTCRTVQFQSEDGKPIADVPVKVMRTKTERNSLGTEEVATFKVLRKLLKKLKTDADGKIQFPELNPNNWYSLVFPKTKKFTGPFDLYVGSKPSDCTQAFVLKDKNFIFEIGPIAPKKTVDNK